MARNLSGAEKTLYTIWERIWGQKKSGISYLYLAHIWFLIKIFKIENFWNLSALFLKIRCSWVPSVVWKLNQFQTQNFHKIEFRKFLKKKFLLSLPSFFSRLHATVLPRHLIKKDQKLIKICYKTLLLQLFGLANIKY